jgi:hypothetical protein
MRSNKSILDSISMNKAASKKEGDFRLPQVEKKGYEMKAVKVARKGTREVGSKGSSRGGMAVRGKLNRIRLDVSLKSSWVFDRLV